MYKNLLPSLLLSGFAFGSFAQPTLTGPNFNPQIGDAFVSRICDSTGVVPGPAGENVTWNFTTLVTTSIDTGTVTACDSTPQCSLFPGSSYAIVAHSTYVIPYYISSSAKLSQNGYYVAHDTNAVYSDPIDQFRYPFTFLTSFSDSFAGVITLDTNVVHETGTIEVVCDGYGILNLPGFADSNVLRVHSTQLFVDSANLFGFPIIQTFQLETYAWYAPNYHSPLLAILLTTQVGGSYTNKAVSYAPVQVHSSGITEIPDISSSLELYPNPAQNELNITCKSGSNEHVRITLADVTGREVAVIAEGGAQSLQHITYNTTGFAKGLYLVRLQSGSGTITRKVVIE